MSTASPIEFIQNTFSDDWTGGYPGQLGQVSASVANVLSTYPAEANIPMGRVVVKGVTVPSVPRNTLAPYSVTLPNTGTVADEVVGIAIRPIVPTANILDGNGKSVASYLVNETVNVFEFGSQGTIWVRPIPGTYLDGDPLFLVVSDILPDQQIGQLTNVGAANNIALPTGSWIGDFTIVFDEPDSVARIKVA